MIVQFHGITFDAPDGWQDVTESLPEGSPPTISKASGASAVQFSIAKYRAGKKPNINPDDLRSFMIDFCKNNSIDLLNIFAKTHNGIMVSGISSESSDEIINAWYLSNGRDVVFVTYVGISKNASILTEELGEAKEIVSSISF